MESALAPERPSRKCSRIRPTRLSPKMAPFSLSVAPGLKQTTQRRQENWNSNRKVRLEIHAYRSQLDQDHSVRADTTRTPRSLLDRHRSTVADSVCDLLLRRDAWRHRRFSSLFLASILQDQPVVPVCARMSGLHGASQGAA